VLVDKSSRLPIPIALRRGVGTIRYRITGHARQHRHHAATVLPAAGDIASAGEDETAGVGTDVSRCEIIVDPPIRYSTPDETMLTLVTCLLGFLCSS
jgi:hypothetical protein